MGFSMKKRQVLDPVGFKSGRAHQFDYVGAVLAQFLIQKTGGTADLILNTSS